VTEPPIRLLDDLGAEFARVAAERESRRRPSPARALAIAAGVLVLLGASAYAVPPTRAAIDDLAASFAGWFEGDEENAPGRALRPEDDAPGWVREQGGRLIAQKAGVGLYVTRSETEQGTMLNFALDEAVGIGNSIDGWHETFADRAALVLGPSAFGRRDFLDERGRIPLLGVTARSVERLVLHYANGPPRVEDGVDGGFVLLVDAWRPLRELVAYDAAGRERERVDVTYLDLRYYCDKEPGCPEP
jgi:hypothetical protein